MYINDLNVSSVQRDPKKNLLSGFKGHLALSRLRSLIQAEQNLQAVFSRSRDLIMTRSSMAPRLLTLDIKNSDFPTEFNLCIKI